MGKWKNYFYFDKYFIYVFGLNNIFKLPNGICFSIQITDYNWFKPGKESMRTSWCVSQQEISWLPDSLKQPVLVKFKCISCHFLCWPASHQANWGFYGFKNSEISHLPPQQVYYFVELSLLLLYQATSRTLLMSLPLFILLPLEFPQGSFLHVYMCIYYFSLQWE